MRYSIGTRLPFLDHKLVESAYRCRQNLNLLINNKGFCFTNILKVKLKL